VFGAQRVVAGGPKRRAAQWLRAVGADDVIALGEDDLGARVAAGKPSSRSTPSRLLWGEPAEKVLTALGTSQLVASSTRHAVVQSGRWQATMNVPAGVLRSAASAVPDGLAVCRLRC